MIVLAAVLAGGVGALVRAEVTRLVTVQGWSGRWATGVVNVAGAAALGALVGAGAGRSAVLVLGAGFLGGLTTFSTWMVETVEGDDVRTASVNVAVPGLLGILVAVLATVLTA